MGIIRYESVNDTIAIITPPWKHHYLNPVIYGIIVSFVRSLLL